VSSLAAELRETFENDLVPSKWSVVSGGAPASSSCGVLAAGQSMQFTGLNHRLLVTAGLNLTSALFVQFVLQLGYDTALGSRSCPIPTLSSAGIVVGYSVDGGITLLPLSLIGAVSNYRRPTQVVLDLPLAARTSSTMLFWWQPQLGTGNVWVCSCLVFFVD
jgi:hypothetical protein